MIRIFQLIWSIKSKWKLNTVLLSWERTCWTTLIQSKSHYGSCSKLWRKTCCRRCSRWTLSSGTENWLNQRHLEHSKPCQFIASRNHSLVERTESKGNSKACKGRNCSHVQVDFRPYNEEHITVRNKTFICLGSRKDCLY